MKIPQNFTLIPDILFKKDKKGDKKNSYKSKIYKSQFRTRSGT